MRAIGLGLGLLGMAIGCYSAWFEVTKGAESPTSGCLALGMVAFALATGAGVAPLVLRRQPARVGVAMITLGALGYLSSALVPPAPAILSHLPAAHTWRLGSAPQSIAPVCATLPQQLHVPAWVEAQPCAFDPLDPSHLCALIATSATENR